MIVDDYAAIAQRCRELAEAKPSPTIGEAMQNSGPAWRRIYESYRQLHSAPGDPVDAAQLSQ